MLCDVIATAFISRGNQASQWDVAVFERAVRSMARRKVIISERDAEKFLKLASRPLCFKTFTEASNMLSLARSAVSLEQPEGPRAPASCAGLRPASGREKEACVLFVTEFLSGLVTRSLGEGGGKVLSRMNSFEIQDRAMKVALNQWPFGTCGSGSESRSGSGSGSRAARTDEKAEEGVELSALHSARDEVSLSAFRSMRGKGGRREGGEEHSVVSVRHAAGPTVSRSAFGISDAADWPPVGPSSDVGDSVSEVLAKRVQLSGARSGNQKKKEKEEAEKKKKIEKKKRRVKSSVETGATEKGRKGGSKGTKRGEAKKEKEEEKKEKKKKKKKKKEEEKEGEEEKKKEEEKAAEVAETGLEEGSATGKKSESSRGETGGGGGGGEEDAESTAASESGSASTSGESARSASRSHVVAGPGAGAAQVRKTQIAKWTAAL